MMNICAKNKLVLTSIAMLAFLSMKSQARVDYEFIYWGAASAKKGVQASPFPSINIQTHQDNLVTMDYEGLSIRSVDEQDKGAYIKYFSSDDVMLNNFYGHGKARPDDRINAAFTMWQGRWSKPKYKQEHYQGAFLIFNKDNKNSFAHMVDGFISFDELNNIRTHSVDDFNDQVGLLGEFKGTLSRLIDDNERGYSSAALDFTGDTVGFFIKSLSELQKVIFIQDTYMHQLSYLGYNWGIEGLLGRTVAHSSMLVMNTETIKAYEAMGYYPFLSKEKRAFGKDQAAVEVINMLKPVNPVQAVFSFYQRKQISANIHLMSYFTANKTIKAKILHEHDGATDEVAMMTYTLHAMTPLTLYFELDNQFAGQLLWLKLEDDEGILDPVLLPMKVNIEG